MEDTAHIRVQYLLAMAYNIVVYQHLNLHVYIKSSEVASDTDETSYGAVSGERHGCTLKLWQALLLFIRKIKFIVKLWRYLLF
jgi:hypothetical protein